MSTLTTEQREQVTALRAEAAAIEAQADEKYHEYHQALKKEGWRKADIALLDEVYALDEAARLKRLVAYIPEGGEKKVARVKKALAKFTGGQQPELGPEAEARLKTLEWVNLWRGELDLPTLDRLPKGSTGDAADCVIARALTEGGWEMNISDGSNWKLVNNETREHYEAGWLDNIDLHAPEEVSRFIELFDHEGYTDLIDQ